MIPGIGKLIGFVTVLYFINAPDSTFLNSGGKLTRTDFSSPLRPIVEITQINEKAMPESAAEESNGSVKVTIKCSCQTKNNPSMCNINTVKFQEIIWRRDGFIKNGDKKDPKFWGEYCKLKRDDGCLCDDIKNFKGEIER
ncbi:MAG: hypothetical protein MPW17_09375 [Candidatus Manganitrophus sp.]|nr:hypothetical protein [Candidatus Manganitrophus sp.]WDT73029.1 MAG: hypothetical protein MPW17_09375 [Candidatus Manganitrophus sp.]WDT74762.1 MAG: hypothetical protein MPW16_16040 [Candidatus Manganitrophus sp.]